MSLQDLEFDGELPEGWVPLEAIMIVKCIDDEGAPSLFHTSTTTLVDWEALGMLMYTTDMLRQGMQAATWESEEEEEEE